MLRYIAIILLVNIGTAMQAQYFQQEITYDISASYDKSTHLVDGVIDIAYTNNAPHSLDTLYLHLWANAMKSKSSPYSEQLINLGNTEFYFTPDSKMGGYEDVTVTIDGVSHELRYKNDEVAYILLSDQLEHREKIALHIDYSLKMPYIYGRFGWTKSKIQLVHWYPSMAVYDRDGWHTMRYLSMGELYSSIGDYKVNISMPYENVVSSGNINGSTVTENITDFAIIAREDTEVITKTIEGIAVTIMHDHNPIIAEKGMKYVTKAITYFTDIIGPYPHKTLAIAEKGKSGGMEYGALVTVGAQDDITFRYYLVHEILHQWFYGSLVTDQRTSAWIDEGFTTYYQQRYFDEVLDMDYFSESMPDIYGKKDHVPILQKAAVAQERRSYAQPICTHISEVSALNYGFNSYEIPARWIGHLAAYIGQDKFDTAIQTLYSDWSSKHPKVSDIKSYIEQASDKDTEWFFDALCGNWSVDYGIEREDETTIKVYNYSTLAAPYLITTTYDDNTSSKTWHQGHTEPHLVTLKSSSKKIKSIKLGPEKGLIDRNTDNNNLGSNPMKLVLGLGIDDDDYREIYLMPLLNYNTSDGLKLGAAIYNSTFGPKKWKYLIAPQYGVKSGRLVGQAWTSYDYYIDHASIRKLYFRLGLKSYDDQYSEVLDKRFRYVKIDPSISIHFRHDVNSGKYSTLSLKTIFLQDELRDDLGMSTFAGSTIFQLGFDATDKYELSPSAISARLEYQSYSNLAGSAENYLKLTTSYRKSWLYAPNKKVNFRLYASYFLINSRRYSSSFHPAFTRGSIALLHQGFNDYSYEEPWFNRNNQLQGIWGQQVSNYGGGFKTPLGSQHGIGQSNDLAVALNVEADVPFNMPKYFPLSLFLDLGYYRTKGADLAKLNGNTLYSGGLALNYGDGMFSIYVPLVHSKAIGDIYSADDVGLLGRISFRMNINKYDPWNIIENYNF